MKPSIAKITQIVAEEFKVKPSDIIEGSKLRIYTKPRFIVYMIANQLGYSLSHTAQRIGSRHHTSVMSGISTAKKFLIQDPHYRKQYLAAWGNVQELIKSKQWKFVSIRGKSQ